MAPLPFPDGSASRTAGLLASGSTALGPLPRRATDFSISHVQWDCAQCVPGYSGGGRAGFSPASHEPHEAFTNPR